MNSSNSTSADSNALDSSSAFDLLPSIPTVWQPSIQSAIGAGERVLAFLELDLDTNRNFAQTLLALTNNRLIQCSVSASGVVEAPKYWEMNPELELQASVLSGLGKTRIAPRRASQIPVAVHLSLRIERRPIFLRLRIHRAEPRAFFDERCRGCSLCVLRRRTAGGSADLPVLHTSRCPLTLGFVDAFETVCQASCKHDYSWDPADNRIDCRVHGSNVLDDSFSRQRLESMGINRWKSTKKFAIR